VRLVGAATCVGLRAAAFALRRVAARLVRAANSSKTRQFFAEKAKKLFFFSSDY
jgi:tagatose-1,6-bisphosphate aldolase non-catalytic subunit AgaZ/GatZ